MYQYNHLEQFRPSEKIEVCITAYHELQSTQIKSRSTKTKYSHYEMSFEKNFIEEHWQCFTEHFKACFPSIEIQEQLVNNIILQYFEEQDGTDKPAESLDLKKNHLLSSTVASQFALDLQNEQKFQKFLILISRRVEDTAANELILVAYHVWEAYLEIRNPLLNDKEETELAKKTASKFGQCSQVKLEIPYLRKKAEGKNSLIEFMKVYCETILLIIGQYFHNPHCSSRARSDEGEPSLQLHELSSSP